MSKTEYSIISKEVAINNAKKRVPQNRQKIAKTNE